MSASTWWVAAAACALPETRNLPWTLDESSTADKARMARVCAACPVRTACADLVAEDAPTAGFWAGRSCVVPEPFMEQLMLPLMWGDLSA